MLLARAEDDAGGSLTTRRDGAGAGKHRAHLSRWRRLEMAIGSVLHTQRRQCRAGHHRYAHPTPIGGGITRSTCSACGTVSLDLREATQPAATHFFKSRDERKTFAILRRQLFHRR